MNKCRIGYTQGTYDLFHVGHLNLLKHAKEMCDYLVVGINSDNLVKTYKHHPPVIGERDRCEIVSNIKGVDKAMLVHTLDKVELLMKIGFDVVFIGDDWKGDKRWNDTEAALRPYNVDVVYLPYTRESKQFCNKGKDRVKIGYTTGCFDMFHIGHLNILRQAKLYCDYLIVGVSTDELMMEYKHKAPIIPFNERCEIIKSVRYVDEVVPQYNRDKIAAYTKYKFDVMFVGNDWQGNPLFNEVETWLKAHGSEVIYFKYTSGISSTLLREKISD